MDRMKRGEVYQLPDNRFTFVCVHCTEEFQLFTDFTLHVQTHFDVDVKPSRLLHTSSDNLNKLEYSTAEPLIAPSDIKQIDESDDDFVFATNYLSESKDESSASDDDDCKKKQFPSTGKKFECFICHKQLASSFVTKRHIARVHRLKDLECKNCHKKFQTSRYYERHNCMAEPNRSTFVSQKPIVDEPTQPTRVYECTVCQRIFRDRRQLESHKAKHKQSPCLCLVCGKLFSGDRTLGRHMKLHEATSESHPCNECGRKFKQRRYLLHHNRKVHNMTVGGPSICEICNQQFENRRLLYIHMESHPVVPKRKFPCSMCNHSALCAYDLKRHIETHSIENRSYECPVCQRKLLPRYVNDHMKTHELTRNFECDECGKRFKRAKTLKRHKSIHQLKAGSGQSPFKCDVCDSEFARMDGLLRHRRKHNVAMNFHCRICNKGFIEQKSFLLHEANHTKGNLKCEQLENLSET